MKRISHKFPSNAPRLKELFYIAAKTRRLAHNTQDAYWRWIRDYIRFHKMTHPGVMDESHITAYLRHLAVARHVSPSTQNQALHALLFLYRGVLGKKLAKITLIPRARVRRRCAPLITNVDFAMILTSTPSQFRLPFQLMYFCGLRCSEVVNLKIEDLADEGRVLKIANSKSLNDRLALVPTALHDQLIEYMNARRALFNKMQHRANKMSHNEKERFEAAWQREPLFPSRHATYDHTLECFRRKTLSTDLLAKILKAAAMQSGTNHNASPHSLRRSFATNAYRSGVTIRALQTILGHKDPNTTCLYIEPFETLSSIKSPLDDLFSDGSKSIQSSQDIDTERDEW